MTRPGNWSRSPTAFGPHTLSAPRLLPRACDRGVIVWLVGGLGSWVVPREGVGRRQGDRIEQTSTHGGSAYARCRSERCWPEGGWRGGGRGG